MRVLVIRQGAFGDNLIITPVIRRLSELGNEVHVMTSERGMEMFRNNPHIKKLHFIKEDPERSEDALQKAWKEKEEEIKAEKVINFTESIECNVALHPRSPRYNFTKSERRAIANRNYYEESFSWAQAKMASVIYQGNEPSEFYRPEIFFDREEKEKAATYMRPEKFNVLVSLSGSGKNKAYPWIAAVMGECLKEMEDIHFITVGDEMCQLMEVSDKRITNLAGKIPIRVAMAMTEEVDLVVSPDTGLLHAAGATDVFKIGLLGHTTRENITKHFENDISIEADSRQAECAPCFRLIYNVAIQCPQDTVSHAAYCMSHGINPKIIVEAIKHTYARYCERQREKNTICA